MDMQFEMRAQYYKHIVKAQHRGNEEAAFVVRDFPVRGSFGFPNVFILHVDHEIALIYYCQSQLFLFNLQDALIITREELYEGDKVEQMVKILEQNGAHLPLYEVYQNTCALRVVPDPPIV